MNKLYERIDSQLQKQQRSRMEMCNATGIPYNTLNSWYRRKSENMKMENLKLIADYLGVTVDWLVTGQGRKELPNDNIYNELGRIYNGLSLRSKSKLLVYAYDLEALDKKNE